MRSLLRAWNSVAVVKPIGTSLAAITEVNTLFYELKEHLKLTSSQDLVSFAFRDALYGQERLSWRESDRFNRAVPSIRELLAVVRRQTVLLYSH